MSSNSELHIDETPARQRDVRPLDDNQVRDFVNQLVPPIGTSFFGTETSTILDNKQLIYTNWAGDKYVAETLTWRTDFYKYVVSAKPDDPNFQQNGGTIYIIMVHGGVARTGGVVGPNIRYMHSVEVSSSSVIPMKQYPATNSGTKNGDNWDYTIGYEQTMPMFNNSGNSAFEFNAKYREDFTRTKSQQTGSETVSGVKFDVKFDDYPDYDEDFPIIAFSIFKCTDPNAFPVKFTFTASVGESATNPMDKATTEVNLDFKF